MRPTNDPAMAAMALMPMARPRSSNGKASVMIAVALASSTAPPACTGVRSRRRAALSPPYVHVNVRPPSPPPCVLRRVLADYDTLRASERLRRMDGMPEAYLVDAVRTPVGRRGGGLSQVHP